MAFSIDALNLWYTCLCTADEKKQLPKGNCPK